MVGCLCVDTFDDIDFAAVRPVGTYCPESGPGPTDRSGHVVEIEDNEASCVIGLLARYAHGVAATAGGDGRSVDAHIYLAILGACEAGGRGRALVDVVHIAVSWVIGLHCKLAIFGSKKESEQEAVRTVKKSNMEKNESGL